jgi:hypothetical protein
MNLKKHVAQAAIAAALGGSALALGVGASPASADPGQPCWQDCQGDHRGDGPQGNRGDDHQWGDQGRPDQWRQGQWQPDQRGDWRPWDQRGIDDARFDHQPFNWQGQRVEPYWDQGRNAWGFWLGPIWIPL